MNLKPVKALITKAEKHYEKEEDYEGIKVLWQALRLLAKKIEENTSDTVHEYFK